MKVVSISDTHNQHGFIDERLLIPADLIICAGDISSRGTKPEVENFLYWYQDLSQYKYKILIAGNHDFFFENDKKEIKKLLKKYPSIIYLQDQGIDIKGINIWGSPVQPWFYNWAFNVTRGPEIKKYWDLIPMNTNILITHGPPKGKLDKTQYNDVVGCEELILAIERVKPKYNIFGHIHEGYGIIRTEDTTYINASILDENYTLKNKPIIFEI